MKELTHWKRPWCLARSKAGEGDDRGWDGWMVSPSWWTWVWASPRTWWWTGKLGVLQSMGLQTIGHNWAIELDWTKECTQVFQVALVVKDPPLPMQEMQVQSLGREDSLKEGTAIHSSILAWRIPWTEEPGGLQSMGLQKVRQVWSDLAWVHAGTHSDSSVQLLSRVQLSAIPWTTAR